MTKATQDFFTRNGIILFKPQMGDTTFRRLCRECGGRAFDTGGQLCPTCFDKYFTKVLRNNPQMVAIHAACYSNDGPVITQLVKCPRKQRIYCHTNPPHAHHWTMDHTYTNEAMPPSDWMDAMRFSVNFMKNRG